MSTKNENLVTYDPSGMFLDETGVSPADLQALTPRLEAARREVLEDDLRLLAEGVVPQEKDPLDAAFFELPEEILAEYQADQTNSELGRIETQIQSHTNTYLVLVDHQNKTTEIKQKLDALRLLSASRLLHGTLLNALQQTTVDDLQLLRLRVEQLYTRFEGTKRRTNDATAAR
jgi:hypothetical protein